jgi:hypothetical protein
MFCRIGCGMPGLLSKLYVDLTMNCWFDVSFHSSSPCSFLVVVAFRIGLRFIMSFMKKDVATWYAGVGCSGRA